MTDQTETPAAPADQTTAPATWVDGHPHLEAIASAVWATCQTENGLVVDDPRNIAVAAYTAMLGAPGDRTALRGRIAEALRGAPSKDLRADWTAPNGPLQITARVDDLADAVLAVLPAPADRAAILREAADVANRLSMQVEHDMKTREIGPLTALQDLADELCRLAAETQPAGAHAADLTDAERTMLRYALDQAQERIWSRDGFTDEDQAAVDSLRRLAPAAERQDGAQPAEPATPEAPEPCPPGCIACATDESHDPA